VDLHRPDHLVEEAVVVEAVVVEAVEEVVDCKYLSPSMVVYCSLGKHHHINILGHNHLDLLQFSYLELLQMALQNMEHWQLLYSF
jgi:hypothetical protein